ncbi:hypothetical protein ACQJBY_000747 [Aegilops geniculata]
MSMSALISALRGAGRQKLSTGTIVTTTQVTGSHLLRIDGCTLKTTANGTLVKSGTFGVGGHDWLIQCYPNGNKGKDGWLSLYLEHVSHSKTGDATASFRMSILDHAGKPWRTEGNTEAGALKYSSPSSTCWGWGNFVETRTWTRRSSSRRTACPSYATSPSSTCTPPTTAPGSRPRVPWCPRASCTSSSWRSCESPRRGWTWRSRSAARPSRRTGGCSPPGRPPSRRSSCWPPRRRGCTSTAWMLQCSRPCFTSSTRTRCRRR